MKAGIVTLILSMVAFGCGGSSNEQGNSNEGMQASNDTQGAENPPAYADNVSENMTQADIVDTAMAAGQFDTLVTAIKQAELVGALKSEGPFTVFAPTDEAFNKLPEGTVSDLLKPENKEKLQEILKYHVVSGKVDAAQVMTMNSADTLAGKSLSINAKEGGVSVNTAAVTKTDIQCSNGVIHVIDTVLIPE